MSPPSLLWFSAAALGMTCLAATSARALAEFSPAELEDICRKRNRPDRLGHVLHWREQVGLAMQSLRTIALAAAAATGSIALWQHSQALGLAVGAWASWLLAGLLLVLAANLWLPRTLARLWADPLLFSAWPVLWGVSFLLVPLSLLAHVVNVALHRLAGRKPSVPDEESFEEDIRTIVSEGHREGLLEEDAREMIEGVIELGDANVSQVMTPLDEHGLHPRRALVGRDARTGDQRRAHAGPRLRPQSRRHPGHPAHQGPPARVDPRAGPARGALDQAAPPAGLRAGDETDRRPAPGIAAEPQSHGRGLGRVWRGLRAGDDGRRLEEIVGEIVDEYDPAHVEGVRELGPGVCEALGRVHIDEINERLGLGLPEDADYDTIGGFVFNELGHIPTTGEDLVWHNVRITVLDATRRRIERVRIEVLDAAGLPTT